MAKQKKLSDQLRQAILKADMSRYQLAQLTGVSQPVLSRFLAGKSGLSLGSVDRIAEVLGLQIAQKKKPKPKR